MPKLPVPETQATLFRLFIRDAETAYTAMEGEVLAQIQRMRLLNISDEEILRRLLAEVDQGLGAFGSFKTRVTSGVQKLTGTTAQLESNVVFQGSEDSLRWTLDPTVQKHCATCLKLSTMAPRTFAKWEAVGLPGEGNTDCGNYCKCSLERARKVAA